MSTTIIGKVRLRILNKVRHTELSFIEKKGHAYIHMKITQDCNTIIQSVPVLISALDDLISVIVIYLYIAFISIETFIVNIAFISCSILYFYSKYFSIKKEMKKSGIKEIEFFSILYGVLHGFKQIKINSKKNNDLFKDVDIVSKESEQLKVQGLVTHRNHVMRIMIINFAMFATILFALPIYFENVRFSILKIFGALLFAQGPYEMVFRSFATIAMTNVAVDNLMQLENELDKTHKLSFDPADNFYDFKKLSLRDISFQYKDSQGETTFNFGPIDLSINKGDVLFIVGGNGSGKSTLLKLLTGLYQPLYAGKIYVDNELIDLHTYPAYRQLFSVIFTDYYLFRKLYGLESVEENKVREMLKTMLLHRKTKFINNQFTNTNLSTGQRKRLACIESLLEDKPINIFDEWTADQDPDFRKYLYDAILPDLRKQGKTVIIVTHDDRYFDRADKVITMEEGKIKHIS